ncbi:sugar phosphate isomerase/epimerase family protein [Sphingobium estronivorans]|uniref:sugar phosphate isomerase/epimerase family protein n=1 Tax=Sphingobium estronivorans TaxID=1577690 RepID=UPI00123BDE5B|nr:sugar phosphate isomerase/epimerase family protein [Sphingobium estronivorans]
MRLSLDHISVTDTTPSQLADIAAATGCTGICPFLHSMAVLPAMPDYDLIADPAERRATKAALAASGVTVDLVYPFTIAGRTVVAAFEPALEVAAELGAPLANILCYDRDPARLVEKLAELADLAAGYRIGLAIEFYPPSQIRTLGDALALIGAVDREDVGVTLDLLHIMRGGDVAGTMRHLADPRICFAQLSDGPLDMAAERLEWEAGLQRQLPGEGSFDIAALLSALRPGLPFSVEAPQEAARKAGVSPLERARRAVAATFAVMTH